MSEKKSIHLTPENHEFVRKLAYNKHTTIQNEANIIIARKRILYNNQEEEKNNGKNGFKLK